MRSSLLTRTSLCNLLSILAGVACLAATHAQAQRTLASYRSTVLSQGPMSYFTFDTGYYNTYQITNAIATNSAYLTVYGSGGLSANFTGGFAPDAWKNPDKSMFFAGSADAVEVYPNTSAGVLNGGGTATTTSMNEGTISFLFRSLDSTNQSGRRTVFSGGGDLATYNGLMLFFEGPNIANADPLSLRVRLGNATQTMLLPHEIQPNAWYYFALSYTEKTNVLDSTGTNAVKGIWYLGKPDGTLISGTLVPYMESVAGDGQKFILGNTTTYSQGFRSPGSGRVDEAATWNRRLSSTEISNQFACLPAAAPAGASYQEVIAAQSPMYYFKLDNSPVDAVGGVISLSTAGTGGAYTTDYFGVPNRAYSFSETDDALYSTMDLIAGGGTAGNTAASGRGTVSLLFRMLSDTNYGGQRFIFSAPGEEDYGTNDNMFALFLENANSTNANPGSLKLRIGNLTKGNSGSSFAENNVPVAYHTNLIPNAWYYFALTYNESVNSYECNLYFGRAGGTLSKVGVDPANVSVVGNNGWFVLGNKIESFGIVNSAFRNPGEGAIDEFAIWHDELSEAEVQAQFAALIMPPNLSITVEGANAVISWPASAGPEFALKVTSNLLSPSWSLAGTPTVVGGNYYVTNSVGSGNQFYRLEK
jgi:hypothetical protein